MARRRQENLAEMEREFEERVEAKQRRGYDSSKRDKKKPKPPLLLRILAWCGVILFCFVVGYVGTGYIVTQIGLDRPWSGPFGEDTGTDVISVTGGTMPYMQRATFSVFYPRGGELVSENVDVISRTFEDNIREAVLRILRLSGIEAVDVLHVFRDIETVYIDLSSPFLSILNELGERPGTLLINGIVRTMNENFSLTRVRFLVDSRVVSSGAPVDLAAVWQ